MSTDHRPPLIRPAASGHPARRRRHGLVSPAAHMDGHHLVRRHLVAHFSGQMTVPHTAHPLDDHLKAWVKRKTKAQVRKITKQLMDEALGDLKAQLGSALDGDGIAGAVARKIYTTVESHLLTWEGGLIDALFAGV